MHTRYNGLGMCELHFLIVQSCLILPLLIEKTDRYKVSTYERICATKSGDMEDPMELRMGAKYRA